MLLKNVVVSRKSVVRNALAPVIEGLENRCLMSATLTVTNLDGLPFNDRMIFNKIQHLDQNFPNVTHDHAQLQLTNSGDAPLTFGTITPSGPWTISPNLSNTTLAVGASQTVTLTFTQSTLPAHAQNQTNFTDNPNGGASIFGSLAIPSNDPAHANTTIALAGYWQSQSEHNAEPNLTVITNFLSGYTTKISDTYKVDLTQPVNSSTQEGDEVVSDMWLAANPNQAVTVRQLAGFHTEGNVVHTYWFTGDTNAQSSHQLFASVANQGQSLLPTNSSGAPLAGQFHPFSTPFGFRVDNEFSNDAINVAKGNMSGAGHHMRFYPLLDRQGVAVPNTWLVGMDYAVLQTQNFDFQDNVYIVTNMTPATTPPAPTNLTATSVADPVLNWTGVTYTNLAGYNIYRSTSPTGTFSLLNTGAPVTGTTFTDTTAPGGTALFYRVTAVDSVSHLESAPATASANVPTGPIANNDSFAVNTAVATPVDVTTNDQDASGTILPSTVTVLSGPSHGSVVKDPTTGVLTYTSNGGFTGTDTLTYDVKDSNNATSTIATVTFTVTNPSVGAPVAQDFDFTDLADSVFSITPQATDAQGSTVTPTSITATTAPTHGTVTVNTTDNTFTYTPTLGANFVGNDSFNYTVTTANGTSNVATVTIHIGVEISSTTLAKRTITYTDLSGTKPTIVLTVGTADVFFNGDGFVNSPVKGNIKVTPNTGGNGNLTIDNIVLTGTNAVSTLAIVTPKNIGSFTLGGVTDTGVVGRILAPRGTLSGSTASTTISAGGLSVLQMNMVTNSSIIVGSQLPSGVAVVAGEVSDSTLNSGVTLKLLRVTDWTNTENANLGVIAPTLGTLLVTGAPKKGSTAAIAGDFQPNLVLSGGSATGSALGTAVVTGQLSLGSWDVVGNARVVVAQTVASSWTGTFENNLGVMLVRSGGLPADITAGSIGNLVVNNGAISNATIESAGNINAIVASSISGSRITAGLTSDVSVGSATAADLGSAVIRVVRLTSKAANAFSDSEILAHTITASVLGNINTANSTSTGLAAVKYTVIVLTANGQVLQAGPKQTASLSAFGDFLATKGIDLGNFQVAFAS